MHRLTLQQKIEALLELARNRGFHIFPLSLQNTPFKGFHWREKSSRDTDTILVWAETYPECNWAVDCGKSGLCVIDLDRHGETDGVATWEKLVAQHYDNEDADLITLISRTPRDGQHRYYSESTQSGTGKLGPGIDIKSAGGYVAIPPSFRYGKPYIFILNSPIAPLPEWIKARLSAPREKKKRALTEEPTEASGDVVDRALKYIESAPRAVEGEGGDFTTYKVACQLRDFGLGAEEALNLMLGWWNEYCSPPWEEDELQKKVENAYRYAENGVGERDPEKVFAGLLPPERGNPVTEEKQSLSGELVFFQDLIAVEAPEMEWIVENWLPAKVGTLFTGQGGTGKSLLAYQLAVSVAYGIPWLGLEIKQSRPVILVLCEDSLAEIHRRAQRINSAPKYSAPEGVARDRNRLAILPRLGKDSRLCALGNTGLVPTVFYNELLKLLRTKYKGQEPLIVLDTVTDVYGHNENDRGLVNQFVKQVLGLLTVSEGATLLTIGHPPKGDSQYSGSTGWDTAYRQRLFLGPFSEEKDRLPDYRKLEVSKSNQGPRGHSLTLRYESGVFAPVAVDGVVDGRQQADSDIIYNIVAEHASKGNAPGMAAQHGIYIGNLDIRDSLGGVMLLPERKRLITLLKLKGLLVEVKGQSRGNGLYPKELAEQIEGKPREKEKTPFEGLT